MTNSGLRREKVLSYRAAHGGKCSKDYYALKLEAAKNATNGRYVLALRVEQVHLDDG